MSVKTLAERALEKGQGVLRLTPTWVPRVFCVPGRRIKLHPDDYYALGGNRGGIDERWFSSTTPPTTAHSPAPMKASASPCSKTAARNSCSFSATPLTH